MHYTWQSSRVMREAEAKAEQQAIQTHLKGLPEGEEGEDEPPGPSLLPAADAAGADQGLQDLSTVLRRMKEIARVLESFQQLREAGRSRAEYMEQVLSGLGQLEWHSLSDPAEYMLSNLIAK